jgi:crotonobetainyl-CoA:carnitine CoA-transferase CaiB-like acyl-CoA transferase
VFDDPFVAARGTVHRFEREDGIAIPTIAYPGKFSATPVQYRRAPPRVGEQSREILSDWLDLDDARFDALQRDGVIGSE